MSITISRTFISNLTLEAQRTYDQAAVVQKLDSAIPWINRYPADKYYEDQFCYPLDSDLSSG